MKLAEVAAGGQQWNFENLPEEPSTPCDVAIDEAVDEDFMTKNGDSYDDGHHDQAEEEAGDEGREADGLRQGGVREGEAREDAGEVLRGEGAQGCLLSCAGSLISA